MTLHKPHRRTHSPWTLRYAAQTRKRRLVRALQLLIERRMPALIGHRAEAVALHICAAL